MHFTPVQIFSVPVERSFALRAGLRVWQYANEPRLPSPSSAARS